MLDIISSFLLAALLLYFVWKWKDPSNKYLPLGPPAWPIVGNLLDIVNNPHLKLSKWAKEYGKLFRIKLGTRTAIVLSDPKVLRDILNKQASMGRFKSDVLMMISKGSYGLINSEGKVFNEVKKFCVQNLKSFGFGNKSMEPIISNQASSLISWINEQKVKDGNTKGVCISDISLVLSLNALWTMVTGEAIPSDDTRISTLIHTYMDGLQDATRSGLGFYPWLRYILPEYSGYNTLKARAIQTRSYIEDQFTKHTKTIQPGHPRDLIDSYIDHLSAVNDSSSAFYGEVGKINAVSSVMELFIAGGDTIAQTMQWALYYLCVHHEVQDKMKQEIFNVIGENGICSLEHKGKMPYTESVILETLRKSSLVPLGLFNQTLEEMTYENFVFPKGTILIPNLYHIHHDESIWGDPEIFRPERFLEEGDDKLMRENVVAFQAGKMSCIGERLAKDALFLFLVKLVQYFEVLKGSDKVDAEFLKPEVGFMLMPGKHTLIFKSREK